jgi:DNA polymerase-4
VVVVPPDRVTAFLHPLDVGELWGVGEKTRTMLHRKGFLTVHDLAHTPLETLRRAVGHHLGTQLHHLAWGTDRGELVARSGPYEPDRSMGAQETFGRDTDDREVIVRELLRLSGRVTGRMRAADVVGRTVTLTVRFADFRTLTRSRTLPEATDVTVEVHGAVTRLYDALGLRHEPLRLVGVRVEGLVPRDSVDRQLVLGEPEHGWADADRAVDRATRRFGSSAVRPASLVGTRRA